MIWMIQTFSACERSTPELAPRAQARVTMRKGARRSSVNHGGTSAMASAASATGKASSATLCRT